MHITYRNRLSQWLTQADRPAQTDEKKESGFFLVNFFSLRLFFTNLNDQNEAFLGHGRYGEGQR